MTMQSRTASGKQAMNASGKQAITSPAGEPEPEGWYLTSTKVESDFENATLASGVLIGATTITLGSSQISKLLPNSSAPYFIKMFEPSDPGTFESIRVTAVSGDVLTVERERESTTAAAWTSAAVARLRFDSSVNYKQLIDVPVMTAPDYLFNVFILSHDDDYVFIGAETRTFVSGTTYTRALKIICHDAVTGAENWQADFPETESVLNSKSGSRVAHNTSTHLAILFYHGNSAGDTEGRDAHVAIFDVTDGSLVQNEEITASIDAAIGTPGVDADKIRIGKIAMVGNSAILQANKGTVALADEPVRVFVSATDGAVTTEAYEIIDTPAGAAASAQVTGTGSVFYSWSGSGTFYILKDGTYDIADSIKDVDGGGASDASWYYHRGQVDPFSSDPYLVKRAVSSGDVESYREYTSSAQVNPVSASTQGVVNNTTLLDQDLIDVYQPVPRKLDTATADYIIPITPSSVRIDDNGNLYFLSANYAKLRNAIDDL